MKWNGVKNDHEMKQNKNLIKWSEMKMKTNEGNGKEKNHEMEQNENEMKII